MRKDKCEITRFPVEIEFRRRGARHCDCPACEAYAERLSRPQPSDFWPNYWDPAARSNAELAAHA